ncbi:MAG: carboxyl-terminal processing protease [Acidobacteriota bacterium]|jgi:carboxyl-terminal processing protease|nr:carboxyl-terminal processing protease [Acidobacteriota bacterium]
MRRSWRIAAIGLFLLTLVLGGLLGDRLLAVTDETRDSLRLYTELVNVAHDRYGADVTYRDLVYSSVNGMLRALDPHTAFLSPEAYEGMREKQQTSFYGLGILVGVRNGQLTVISPLEGTPASRLGIQAGDVISTIEGEATDSMNLDEAVGKLKGPKGTQVKITIVRRGLEQPLAMSVTRAEIPQTTVRQTYMLNPTTGYIQLTEFARGSGHEMADALDKLRKSGMKQLVVDLRNNGGGLLDQAIEIADQFLPEDSMIVQTKGRTRDSFQNYKASGKYPPLDVPVVVLVNEGTASASEILSGALQDHDRALVVGTPSWGKGLVQTVYNLSYGAGLALTTAKYYTPSGRLIQRDYTSYYDYYTHADAGSPEITGKPVDAKEVFHTDLNRTVYGGGGITPDVIVKEEEQSPFEQFLLSRNAYLNFAVDYASRNKVTKDWNPDQNKVIDEFGRWLVKEKLTTQEELDKNLTQKDIRDYSMLQIRAEIANSTSGQEARHRVLAGGDKQLQQALGLFDRASTMLAQRRELGPKVNQGTQTKGKL